MAVVLVTRPAAVAARTVATVRRLGHTALLAPVSRIEPIAAPPPDFDGVQALLVTSRNAVPAVAAWSIPVPVYAVGAGTADALAAAGVAIAGRGDGDGVSLGHRLAIDLRPADGALLHAAGASRAEGLERTVRKAGFAYRVHTVYRAVPSDSLPPEVHAALVARAVDAVTLHSPQSADRFAALLHAAGLADRAAHLVAFCLSANVAEAANRLRWRSVEIADQPDERGMGALLEAVEL